MASTLSANGHSPAKRAAPDLRTSDLRTSDPPSFAQSSFPQSSFPTLFRPGARIVIEEPRPDGGYACTTPSLDDLVAYVAACLGVRVAAARSVAAGPGKCGTCGRERSADRRGYLFCSWCRGAAIRNGKAAKKEARS